MSLSRESSEDNDRLQDFNIWQRLPTGDVLITDQNPAIYRAPGAAGGKDFVFHLVPGLYVAKLYCEKNDGLISLTVHSFYRDSSLLKLGIPGPGIRVRRTTVIAPGFPALTRTYRYEAKGISSGKSLLPNLGKGFERYAFTITHVSNNQTVSNETKCHFISTSSENRGLGNEFNKYDFYYTCVQEDAGDKQGGRVNTYTHFPQQFNEVMPVSQQVYRQHPTETLKRQLIEQVDYRYTAGETAYPLLRVREIERYAGSNTVVPPNAYSGTVYDIVASVIEPDSTKQFRYDDQGLAFATTKHFDYVQHRLVRTTTSTSNGWEITRHKRLSDYAINVGPTTLRTNHFNPIIETQAWRRSATEADSVLIGGQLSFFDATRHPVGAWTLRLSQPMSGPNAERKISGSFVSFKSDTRYQAEDSVSFDPTTGRLRERRPPQGQATSYLWGYNRAYIIAQVENATYAQLLAVLSQATITKLQGANPGNDEQVRALLRPLHTRLPQARVSTCTYAPLVGMTSQTDPSGRTITFEYDGLGRLLRTRDEQGRILSQQQYHYAQP